MSDDWREFEGLISRIESTLAPTGAVVKSPDYIKDLITGQDREVDASIRYRIGSVPILITVECRKRGKIQDDTWIEQLATKREKIGAAKTIAVSSSGFTSPTVATARLKGIELRQIAEITADEIASWIVVKEIEKVVERPELRTLRVGVYGGPAIIHPEVIKSVQAEGAAAPILLQQSDGRHYAIRDVVNVYQQQGRSFCPDAPVDGSRVWCDLVIHFPDKTMSIMTEDGPRFVEQLLLGLEVSYESSVVSITKGFEYADNQSALAHGTEQEFSFAGMDCRLTLCKPVDSDEIHWSVGLRKQPDTSQ